ncbi:hypothetical protein [Lonsdalea quercina]|uniref:hypothetical protein n=1 Tax=Lonsdalea quercina TaxID=71657 RepID=UPI0039754584
MTRRPDWGLSAVYWFLGIRSTISGGGAKADITHSINSPYLTCNANTDTHGRITDCSNSPLKPNDLSTVLPFTLDDAASANVTITAYPVSVTGNKPTEGVATA